jgi:ABC-2 type transport system ATP-binding protein
MPSERDPLEARSLGRSYGRLVALADLDLRVAAGQCVALIGANGSGKTTAVKAISGLLQPTEGTVRVSGFDPHQEPEAEPARAELALVPDTPVLYDELTVRHHLELVALSHGVADCELDARIGLLLERLGLAARAAFVPRELSRGMRQKTQLACALVRPASVLVLDEPIVGLDPVADPPARDPERAPPGRRGGPADHAPDRIRRRPGRPCADAGRRPLVEQGPWADVSARIRAHGWFSR